MNFKGERILVVVAHPDDEVLGMGATIHKLSKNNEIHVFYMNSVSNIRQKGQDLSIDEVKMQIANVAFELKFNSFIRGNLNACKFDSYDQVFINDKIDSLVKQLKPTIVFTHDENDLNHDHSIVFNGVLVSCRSRKGCSVKRIYSFPVLSSSNWNTNRLDYNVYSKVSRINILAKIKAMKCYDYEYKYDLLRQENAIKTTAMFYGLDVESKYAEVFKLIKEIWQE